MAALQYHLPLHAWGFVLRARQLQALREGASSVLLQASPKQGLQASSKQSTQAAAAAASAAAAAVAGKQRAAIQCRSNGVLARHCKAFRSE